MPNSPLRRYPYPSLSDSAIVPDDMRRLAEAVDADVSSVAGSAISAVTRAAELAELVSGIRSIQTIRVDDGGATATITYTNGTTERITLPRGPAGEAAGPFVDLIDNGDGTATVVLYDGSERTLTLPEGTPGKPGDPGEPGPANSLTIGTVTAGDTASATIRGTAPNQVLDLVLPRGEKGDSGGVQSTGWRNIGHLAGAGGPDRMRVRRVGQVVYAVLSNASAGTRWTTTGGFAPDGEYQATVRNPSAVASDSVPVSFPKVFCNSTTVGIIPTSLPATGQFWYFTADPWPTTLPGDPA